MNFNLIEFAKFRWEENVLFQHLTDLGMQRTLLQSLGFLLTYLLVYLLIGVVAGFIIAVLFDVRFDGSSGARLKTTLEAGSAASSIFAGGIAVMICQKKSLSFGWYFLAISAVIISIFGPNVALAFAAFLTTRPNESEPIRDRWSF